MHGSMILVSSQSFTNLVLLDSLFFFKTHPIIDCLNAIPNFYKNIKIMGFSHI